MNNISHKKYTLMIFHKGYSSKLFKDDESMVRIKKIWAYGTVFYLAMYTLITKYCDDEKKSKLVSYIGMMYFMDILALGIHHKKNKLEIKEEQQDPVSSITEEQLHQYRMLKQRLILAKTMHEIRMKKQQEQNESSDVQDNKIINMMVDIEEEEEEDNEVLEDFSDYESIEFPIYKSNSEQMEPNM